MRGIMNQRRWLIIIGLTAAILLNVNAQETDYDESKVPKYILPDALTLCDGTKVKNVAGEAAAGNPEAFPRGGLRQVPGQA